MLVLSDFTLSKKYFTLINKQFANDVNIFPSSNCISFDDLLGFKPVWGNCGYPKLSSYLMNDSNPKILGMANTENIIILGDSNSDWSGFDQILEMKLNNVKFQKNKNYHVINMGVAGYDTYQEANLFFSEAAHISAKLIVLQFTPNDFDFSPVILTNRDNTYLINSNRFVLKPNQFLFNNSAIYKIILLTNLKNQNNRISKSEKINKIKNSIIKLNNFAGKKNIAFLAVIYPVFNAGYNNASKNEIINILNNLKISFIVLSETSELKKSPEIFALKPQAGTDFTHSSRDFDHLVAEEIYRLAKRKLGLR